MTKCFIKLEDVPLKLGCKTTNKVHDEDMYVIWELNSDWNIRIAYGYQDALGEFLKTI